MFIRRKTFHRLRGYRTMHTIRRTQKIPITEEQAWDFFSSPENLPIITPPGMGFIIRSEIPAVMYEGLFIHYTVKPLFNIPVHWVTEITHIRKPFFFVDKQRKGPYRVWHHQHLFTPVAGGVEMTDIVDYQIPFGAIGKLLHALIIRKKIISIFEYRRKKLIELFGEFRD